MLEDEFNKQRANLLRDLASHADPFIKRRLLDLAARGGIFVGRSPGQCGLASGAGMGWLGCGHRRDRVCRDTGRARFSDLTLALAGRAR